jgi:hypothetical protein
MGQGFPAFGRNAATNRMWRGKRSDLHDNKNEGIMQVGLPNPVHERDLAGRWSQPPWMQ